MGQGTTRLQSTMAGVRHIVMFTFKEDTTQEQINALSDALIKMKDTIPEIQAVTPKVDLMLASGQNHPAGKNRSMVAMVDFESAEAYEVYAAHEDHKKVIDDFIKPIMEPGSRAAIQIAL